jgi:hypothetical protein
MVCTCIILVARYQHVIVLLNLTMDMATRVLYIINHIGQRWHCNLVWMDNLIVSNKRGVWGPLNLSRKRPSGRGVQHYVIKFVSCDRSVVYSGFLHQKNWSPRSLQSQESLNRPVVVLDSLNRVLTLLLFRICSVMFSIIKNLFSNVQYCSESVQYMFSNVKTLFRLSSTKTGLFRLSWLCSDLGDHNSCRH